MTNAKRINTGRGVIVCTLLCLLTDVVYASAVSVTVLKADGQGLADAVVVAETSQGYPAVHGVLKSAIDQRDLMFVPEVLVVRTGTSVDFPNSDQVRHQVYSFSAAKNFQLPLYAGRTHPPVLFDHAGLVTLGCNIHDGMIGYIYVTDSPWYGRTDSTGKLHLSDLPAGSFTVKVWHPHWNEGHQPLEQPIKLDEGQTGEVTVKLKKPLQNSVHHHGTGRRWKAY